MAAEYDDTALSLNDDQINENRELHQNIGGHHHHCPYKCVHAVKIVKYGIWK